MVRSRRDSRLCILFCQYSPFKRLLTNSGLLGAPIIDRKDPSPIVISSESRAKGNVKLNERAPTSCFKDQETIFLKNKIMSLLTPRPQLWRGTQLLYRAYSMSIYFPVMIKRFLSTSYTDVLR